MYFTEKHGLNNLDEKRYKNAENKIYAKSGLDNLNAIEKQRIQFEKENDSLRLEIKNQLEPKITKLENQAIDLAQKRDSYIIATNNFESFFSHFLNDMEMNFIIHGNDIESYVQSKNLHKDKIATTIERLTKLELITTGRWADDYNFNSSLTKFGEVTKIIIERRLTQIP